MKEFYEIKNIIWSGFGKLGEDFSDINLRVNRSGLEKGDILSYSNNEKGLYVRDASEEVVKLQIITNNSKDYAKVEEGMLLKKL